MARKGARERSAPHYMFQYMLAIAHLRKARSEDRHSSEGTVRRRFDPVRLFRPLRAALRIR